MTDSSTRGRDTVRCGRIAYTNVLPIYAAFDAGVVAFPGSLISGVPSALNAMLLDGRLDLGPISAACWAQHADELTLLPELCIGARDAVWSVVCHSRMPLDALGGATIAVTPDSASGRALLRVLLERRYGVRATFAENDDPFAAAQRGEPALLIGDRALDARAMLPPETVYDLAHEWHAWTGLDSVFAVWAVRRGELAAASSHARSDASPHEPYMASGDALTAPLELLSVPPGMADWPVDVSEPPLDTSLQTSAEAPAGIARAFDALLAARGWGARNAAAVRDAAQKQRERESGFYAGYYDALNFSFDQRARAGLARFIDELYALGALKEVPSTEPEALFAAR